MRRSLHRLLLPASVLAAAGMAAAASAEPVQVVGGQTSVALDTDLLAAAANLNLTGASEDVIAPGELPGSVAFPINPTDGTPPTTFQYDSEDFFGSFSGTIEHTGTITFNDAITVGDFSIQYDGTRAGTLDGLASGFYVASTTGLAAILFDLTLPSEAVTTPEELVLVSDLLVSPEFSGVLVSAELADGPLAGADVGDARVAGAAFAVPTPAAVLPGLLLLGTLAARRRR